MAKREGENDTERKREKERISESEWERENVCVCVCVYSGEKKGCESARSWIQYEVAPNAFLIYRSNARNQQLLLPTKDSYTLRGKDCSPQINPAVLRRVFVSWVSNYLRARDQSQVRLNIRIAPLSSRFVFALGRSATLFSNAKGHR